MKLPQDLLDKFNDIEDSLPPPNQKVLILVIKEAELQYPEENGKHSWWKEDLFGKKLLLGWGKLNKDEHLL